jgi:glycosyltransferase involved in cell wall biosynthesis
MTLSRIAVDLTPLLPGGENGGAKLLAMETVRALSRLVPGCQFLLLTSKRSHDELACLDASNVSRRCVNPPEEASPNVVSTPRKRLLRIPPLAEMVSLIPPAVRSAVPPSVRSAIKYFVYGPVRPSGTSGFAAQFGADLLFCPFTMPFYHESTIPTVSVLYDLQYAYYPEFFDEDDRSGRARSFSETCRLSTRLVCISEFVRKTVLENSSVRPEQVVTIPIRLAGRLPRPHKDKRRAVLEKHCLSENCYFFYPANFWAHKNHRMLLTAYGMYRARNPRSPIKLVCTGSADERMRAVREAVSQMGLEQWVCLPGFLTEEDFAALFACSYALVFPSLYEGFGMPIVEAMTLGKPVLCSDVTSLPEVAGEAAIYFCPKKPEQIVSAMERITEDRHVLEQLVAKGIAHSVTYVDSVRMASEYLAVFRDALR